VKEKKMMVNRVQEEVKYLQRRLDDQADAVSSQLKISRPKARAKVKKAWLDGCILCNRQGPTALHYHEGQIYVICVECDIAYTMEHSEKDLRKSIARRLARRAKASSASRN